MKILQVTPTYYPNLGGIEAVVRNISRALTAQGHEVEIAHLATDHTAQSDYDPLASASVHRIPIRGNRLVGLAPLLANVAGQDDILHVHDPQLMAVTASVLRYAPRKPRVLSTHGFYGHTKKLSLFKTLHQHLLFARLLSRYDRVLPSSKADYAKAKKHARNVELFENGIDCAAFQSSTNSPRNLRRWLYWGRISQNKRPDLLMDLLHAVRARGEDVHLVIAGPDFDDMADRLAERRRTLGLEQATRICGPLDHEALTSEIARAGLFVSASEYEGFGLTFIEAMAGGLGIVSRNRAPMADFAVNSGAGVAVDFAQIDEAAAAICAFMARPAEEIGQNARAFAETFDWSAKAPSLEAIYSQVLGDHKTPSRLSSS